MVGSIAQEERILFKEVRNPSERLDLTTARTTIDYYALAKLNATSINFKDWSLVRER